MSTPLDDRPTARSEAERCFAVVTGGGTSGHVLPALAILDALVERGRTPAQLQYVGTRRGIETKLLPATPYTPTYLDVVGLQRSLSARNLLFVPKLVGSVIGAWRLLRRLRPQVVVNVGGYASFPASAAALLRRVPLVVVSYDRRPGLVSRLVARRAAATAAAFEGSPLPRAEFTGAPIRRDLVHIDRHAGRPSACQRLGLPEDRTIIAVMCGSQGARAINTAIAEMAETWSDRSDLALYHVVGERYLGEAAPARDGASGILYRVIGYESDMAAVYTAADLMITRAGAGTLAELTTVGVPAVVVPWPGAAENHQEDNARELSSSGAVVLLLEADLTELPQRVGDLLDQPEARSELAAAAYRAGSHHRSSALVDLIERVAR